MVVHTLNFMAKTKSSNGTVRSYSTLERRFADFQTSTGSVLTQSDIEAGEEPDLPVGSSFVGCGRVSPEDPSVRALVQNGFHIVRRR